MPVSWEAGVHAARSLAISRPHIYTWRKQINIHWSLAADTSRHDNLTSMAILVSNNITMGVARKNAGGANNLV